MIFTGKARAGVELDVRASSMRHELTEFCSRRGGAPAEWQFTATGGLLPTMRRTNVSEVHNTGKLIQPRA